MRTLKVKFSILMKKTNFCGALTTYFGKETFFVKKQETDKVAIWFSISLSMILNTSWLISIMLILKQSK